MMVNNQDPNGRAPGKLTDQDQAQAEAIQQTATAAVLATCLGKTYGKVIGSNGFKAYVDATLATAGNPTDPIERMLIEQLLLAHHRIGELHAQSACANSPEEVALYNAAAARLLNEFRKTSLALREYRTPTTSRNVTLVNQQNIANGNQQVAYVDGQQAGEKNYQRTELDSNKPEAITYEQPVKLYTEPATCGSGEEELVEATRAHT